MITIRLRKNGPYIIESDDVQVVDWDGVTFSIDRRPIALCRCGRSGTKPFCDGTHRRTDLQADQPAGPAAGSGVQT